MPNPNDVPRRARLDQLTPAEKAIYDATQVVERAGGGVHLTEAVVLLGKARDKVADHADGVPVVDPLRPAYPVSKEMRERIDRDFSYHRPTADQPARYEAIRAKARELALMIVEQVPGGREQATALTRLEEAVMHANAGIARGL